MYTKIFTLLISFSLISIGAEKITYDDHIKDIFLNSCGNCHKPSKKKGGLNLLTYKDVLKGGSSGKIVESGNTDCSLVTCVTHEAEPIMPPKGPKLAKAEIDLIKKWVNGGLLENSKSKRIQAANNNLAMKMPAVKKGEIILPRYLNLEPFLKTSVANPVTAIDASPYSPLLAVGGYKQILFYNSDHLALEGVLPFPEGQIYDIKFSRDGSLLLASGGINGKKGVVSLWDVRTGKRLFMLDKDFDATLSADISADRKFLATGSSDKLVKIYSAENGTLLHSIKQHSEWLTNVSFSPDGVLLATGDRNGHIYIWESESGQKLYTFMHHKAKITSLSWRSDSNLIASSSEDGEVVVWNIINGKQARRFKPHSAGTLDVFYTQKGELVTCGRDNSVQVYDAGYKRIKHFKTTDLPLCSVADPKSQFAYATNWRGELIQYDFKSNKQKMTAKTNPVSVSEQISLSQNRLDSLLQQESKLQKNVTDAKKVIDSYNARKKQRDQFKNELKNIERQIHELRQHQQRAKKPEDKKKLENDIKTAHARLNQTRKSYESAEKDVRLREKGLKDRIKLLSDRQKALEAHQSHLEFEQARLQRLQAEVINVDRHKVLAEIEALQQEVMNNKYSVEDFKDLIKGNIAKAKELKELGSKIEQEMTEDEALATLLKRYETQVKLKKEAAETEIKIGEFQQALPAIEQKLQAVKEKEKQLMSEYLGQLPEKFKHSK